MGHRCILIKCTDLQPTHKRIKAISIQKHNVEKLDEGEGDYNQNIFLWTGRKDILLFISIMV